MDRKLPQLPQSNSVPTNTPVYSEKEVPKITEGLVWTPVATSDESMVDITIQTNEG